MVRNLIHLKHSDIPRIRKKILEVQDGECAICLRKVKRACLDHSHVKRIKGTGRIRGVLCSSCNIFLAKSENNAVRYGITHDFLPWVLRSMADYLERPHSHFLHPSERPKAPCLTKSSYKRLYKVAQCTIPSYPRSGKLTKKLAYFFRLYGISPEYYTKNGR